MKVLVVEDDEHIAAHITKTLSDARMMVTHVSNGTTASSMLDRARKQASHFDAVVLDLTLPGMDGIDVLKRMRAMSDSTPILVLTARSSLTERVSGLEFGADDYLTKPFEPEELVVRLRVLSRRSATTTANIRKLGNLGFDASKSMFMVGDRQVNLTRKANALLEAIFKRHPNTVPRDFLLELDAEGMSTDALTIQISRIRKVLQDAGCNVTVKATHGIGYSLQVVEES